MAKIEKMVRAELPHPSAKNYLAVLIDECVKAYHRCMSDTLALNYIGVTGKDRAMVLENDDYRRRTRQAAAEKHMEIIVEVEQMAQDLTSEMPDERDYNIREPGVADRYDKDYKDNLNQRLKVLDIKRDVLRMGHDTDDSNEVDAINIFFIPITREEFERLGTVEVHEATTDDVGVAFVVDKGDDPLQQKLTEREHEFVESDFEYQTNDDGSLEDF